MTLPKYPSFLALLIFLILISHSNATFAQYGTKLYQHSGHTYSGYFYEFKNKLYILSSVNNATNTYGALYLFSLDGTSAPQVEIPLSSKTSNNMNFRPYMHNIIAHIGDTMYYPGGNANYENGLWGYDGTTFFEIAVLPNSSGSSGLPYNMVVYNGILYFLVNVVGDVVELYEYNPSHDSVRRLTYTQFATPGPRGIDQAAGLAVYKNKVYFSSAYFSGDYKLCSYDIANDTVELVAGPLAGYGSYPYDLVVIRGKLYFVATADHQQQILKYRWYEYDGISPPAKLNNGQGGFVPVPRYHSPYFLVHNDELYFNEVDITNYFPHGYKVTKYNPDSAKFFTVYDMPKYHPTSKTNAGPDWFDFYNNELVIFLDGWLYFPGQDTFHPAPCPIPIQNVNLVGWHQYKGGIYLPAAIAWAGQSLGAGLFHYTDTTSFVNIPATIGKPPAFFPNPVKDMLHINVRVSTTVTICNLSGQIVHHGKVNHHNNKVNLSHLPAGIYYLHLKGDKEVNTTSFIKE